ncbi:MAG: protein kinase domain-containing protein [Pyrinomonadaceae bacterium]
MSVNAGSHLGRFSLLDRIGAGGMGEIFLAHDPQLERRVALKILPERYTQDADRLERFVREAKAASSLNHPNILTIFEIGSVGETHFIAIEFIDGHTLRDKITARSLELDVILSITRQTAEALAAAHAAGIVHRDIKPENIMVRRDGYVKVLDFGLAKLSELTSDDTSDEAKEASTRRLALTSPGMVMGTAAYMSPEQTRGLADLDGRTDVWSLGVVLYEMLTGRRPFEGETSSDIIASILRSEPGDITKAFPGCPAELERIVTKALKKDRDERYQSVKDLAVDLRALRKDLEFSRSSPGRTNGSSRSEARAVTTTSERAAAGSRRPIILGVVIAAVVIIAAFAGWRWFAAGSGGVEAGDIGSLKVVDVFSWASASGEVYSVGRFSPDGRTIAFESTRSGSKHIWIKQVAAGDAVQITKDEAANEQPVWSPDGQELAYVSTRGNKVGIWRMPALGGSPRLVANLADRAVQLRRWDKSGPIYFASEGELYSADPASGTIGKLTDLASRSVAAQSIDISPDGLQIAYRTASDRSWEIWAARLDSLSTARRVLSAGREVRNIRWHPDGVRILFSRETDGTFQIFAADSNAADAEPVQLTAAERDCMLQDVSADGARLLFGAAKEESDIWLSDVRAGGDSVVTSDIDAELWPSVSPDGRTLAYQSIKNLSQGNKLTTGSIVSRGVSAGAASTVSQITASGYLPTWSPDGSMIAFGKSDGGRNQIFVVSSTGGGERVVTPNASTAPSYSVLPYNRGQNSDFGWAADSRRLAYVSNDGGASNVWIADTSQLDGGPAAERLTGNQDKLTAMQAPTWRPDRANELAFVERRTEYAGDDPRMTYTVRLADTTSGAGRELGRYDDYIKIVGWLAGGREILLASDASGLDAALPSTVDLLSIDVESGRSRSVARLTEAYLYNIQVSPSGKSVAFAAHRDGKDDLWMMPLPGVPRRLTANNDPRVHFSSMAWAPDENFIYFGKQLRYSLLSMVTNYK